MADLATTAGVPIAGASLLDRKKHAFPGWVTGAVVIVALLGGLGYVGIHIVDDLGNVTLGSTWPYLLLGVALLIALGFEFVNGFHDTANAVATVIYTHTLDPNIAVVWSGLCNLAGVLTSAGAVAFTIITLLPVELPVSTTHVLSSGVAGTMAANKSGLQLATIRNIVAAWVFTLPVAALLSGTLYWVLQRLA